jgi:hypothetical protein
MCTDKNFLSSRSLHCDKMGNYEELQCDRERCWCVNPKTGINVKLGKKNNAIV